MKLNKYLFSVLLFVLYSNISSAQVAVPFTQRLAGGSIKIKGDLIFVGNQITNTTDNIPGHASTDPNVPYTGTDNNNGHRFAYVDIDGDASTFSSSSANLAITGTCRKIRYAGLYWTATYPFEVSGPGGNGTSSNYTGSPRMNDWNNIKFKLPTGGYIDLSADTAADPAGQEDDIIFDGFNAANPNNSFYAAPYVCYKNVTSLLQSLANPNGTYTVANVRAARGIRPDGISSGWSLVVIYEDPALPSKYISVFDGYANIFSGINAANAIDFNVNGFQTLPAPLPVRARIGISTLEGDYSLTGDNLRFKANSLGAFTTITNTLNPNNNFFNGSVTTNNVAVLTRNPASTNTLGFDLDIVGVNNPGNSIIPNNETGATLRVTTNGDAYGTYLTTFDVEIIEPKVVLTKVVQNAAGVDIGNQEVSLCQDLQYVIGYQNIGNDDAQNFTIRDVLPINVNFNPATDLTLPPGVTYTYNAGTKTIIFNIPNNQVNIGDPRQEIRIRVRVVCSCYDLDDACSNLIQNQAFATYQGVLNTDQITDDPSLSTYTVCNAGGPSPTNFLVGLDDCNFNHALEICGNNPMQLTAAAGYQSYSWTGPGIVGPNNTQTITINQPGTYTVNDIINTSPCKSIVETFVVTPFAGSALANPVIPYADQIAICPNDNKELPLIFLCGASDSQLIQTSIAGATSIEWQQLNTASCAAVTNPNCANENPSCTWTTVGTGANFTATNAGEYRIRINFPNGCSRIFYFNVFKNLLDPNYVATDVICNTLGSITVTNVPPGYQYQLLNAANVVIVPWQSSNVFGSLASGIYTVEIRQTGVTGGCVFTLPNIPIRARNFTVTYTLTQPLCFGDKGSINIAANDVEPQYTFTIYQGATQVATSGLITPNNYVFPNLSPGTYNYVVTTQDGCNGTGTFTINTPPVINLTASLTKPLSCTDGEITANVVGGVSPFNYVITYPDATVVTQSSPIIVANIPGLYSITVYDYNNCSATTTITVSNNPPPTFTVTSTNILCYGNNNGSITFNVSNANGYTLGYSITGGAPFSSTPTFTNLVAGTYTAVVQYTLGTAVCTTATETITITEPAQALTASGGVAAVACASNGGNGIVRITNVQGGTPYPGPNFYQYNFGSGYQNSNQANLPPGTYTISVRDANLCEYFMTVTLDPIPPDPTISVSAPVFSCTGTATSTVTVNNNGSSYTYTYSINPPLVPPHDPNSNVFQNVPCGNPVVTVNYTLVSPPTFSNLLFEDFGSGPDTTSPGINPAYCFERQINNPAIYCKSGPEINDGDYSVTKKILFPYAAWYNFLDHTTNGTNPNGRFLAINIGGVAGVGGILYSKPIADIIPNQDIKVSLWAANLLKIDPSNTQSPPDLTIQLVKNLGLPTESIIASSNTGNIPKSNAWINYQLTLNPGSNTNLSFVIRSNIAVTSGNDVVIDDINVFQLPVSCLSQRTFPLNIPCNQAFNAQITGHKDVSCAGANDATITIAAQNFNTTNGFQISMNNGATWTTHLTSPVTVPVPVGYPGFVLVRFDSTPSNSTCSLNLPQAIITPPVLSVTATATLATCTTGATITATGNGGTPAYQYQLTNSGGTVIVPFQSSNVFNNITSGSYVVVIRDFNLCTATIPITITPAPTPTATIAASSDYCYDAVNGASLVVNAAGGTPPYMYNINGGTYQSSNTFSPLTPGNYTIVVRDSFGCTVTLPVQTINPQVALSTVLTKDLDCTASPNATISGTITAGTGYSPYTVLVNGTTNVPVTGNTFTYTVTTAGTYTFVVTDARGCTAQSVMVINPLVPVSATTTVVNNLCFGNTAGSVTIAPSGGVGPYTIQFNGSGPFTSQATYSGLACGTYTYIVRDSKSCTFNGTVTVNCPASPLSATAAITTPFTCTNNGIITVTASGGTSPYTYSIDGTTFQAGNTFTVTSSGNYVITVKDFNGCTTTVNITVPALTPPTDISFAATALSCPANTSNVTLTVTGGSLPLLYQIIAGPGAPIPAAPQSGNVFNNLAPGTYTFEVTDSKNCKYSESFTINPLPAVAVTSNVINNVRCFGSSTGSFSFTVSNYGTSYNYTTSPNIGSGTGISAATTTITNVPAGTYTITVTNTTTNCTGTATVTIANPSSALASTITNTQVTCTTNGSATVNATGGWGGYTYSISPVAGVQSGNFFSNLPANTYTITTTDAGGCSVTNTFTLATPTPPTASISPLSDYCYDTTNGATLIVNASGGVGPYLYSINGGTFQSNNTFGPLTPGNYTIRVKDSYGCMVTMPTESINPQIALNTVLTKDLDCSASPSAIITGTITAGSGYGPYTVLLNGSTVVPVAGNTFTYSTAIPGTYTFVVTDAKGCTAQSTVVINALVPVSATTTVVNNQCFGDTAGSVTITPSGGVGPYTIQFNGSGPFTSQTTYSGLAAGTYTYIVRDSKSCTFSGSFTITSPPQITYTEVVNPIQCTASGYTLGSICVQSLSGGVPGYIYQLIDLTGGGVGNQTHIDATGANFCFTNVDFGMYNLIVTDGNGCSVVKSNLVMTNPPSDLNFIITPTIPSCAAGATVTVTLSGSLPSSTYEFGIMTMPNPPYAATFFTPNNGPISHIFTGLTPGVIYTFVVRDTATGCYYFETMTAPTPTNSTLVPTLVPHNVTCKDANDGSVSGSLSGVGAGCTSVSYVVQYASSGLPAGPVGTIPGPLFNFTNIGPLAPGSYMIYFSEVNGANAGCGVTSSPFTISQSAVDVAFTTTVTPANCNANGQIAVSVSGGTAPYTFQYLTAPVGTPPTASSGGWVSTNPFNGPAGNYVVYVKDANDCIKSANVTIGTDPVPVIAATLVNACVAQGTYSINVTMPTAGVAPYSYSIDGGTFTTAYTAPFTLTGLSSGTHTIQVRDKNGCGNTVNVNILDPLVASGAFTTQPTCNTADGQITVTATGGSGTYNYSISPNTGITLSGNVFSNVAPGNYTITVTDPSTGCSVTTNVNLVAPDPVTFTLASTPPTCAGANNASITVTLGAGNNDPNYTYQITAPLAFATGPQSSNVFNNLAPANYTILVTSGRGCPATGTINIIDPTAVSGTASLPTPVFTCNASNTLNQTTLTITGSGGTGTYTYSINNVDYFTTNTFNITATAAAQIITYYVKDANGCLFSNTIVVPGYTPLNATLTVNQTIDCTRPAIVTVTATGGSGNYTYATLPAGASNVTQGVGPLANQFTITAPGTYYFRVTDATTGCYFDTAAYVIAPFNTIDVVATATAPVTCFGGANGALSINVTGYSGAYTYQVIDVATSLPVASGSGNTSTNPLTISGLSIGNYIVNVTETATPFCVESSNVVTISQIDTLTIQQAIPTPANCNANGQIAVSVSGGTAPYTFQYLNSPSVPPTAASSGWVSTNPFIGPAGTYDVYVKDANDCITSTTVTIGTDPVPVIAATLVNACVAQGTYSINVTMPTTGVAPYSYSIDGGTFTTAYTAPFTLTGLSSGTHTIQVRDKNGCGNTVNVNILDPLVASGAFTTQPTCNTANGQITVTATGGSGTYNYSISPNTGITLSGNVFSNVAPGNYTITVTDPSTGCSVTTNVNLVAPDPVTFTLASTPPTCAGANNASITVTLGAGNNDPNYTYQITAPLAFATGPQSSNVFNNLAPANYTILVTSGRGCPATGTINIIDPTAVSVPTPVVTQFACSAGTNSNNLATITVNGVTGGTGTYTVYEFVLGGTIVQSGTSNVYSTANASGGTYTINVYDSNGCIGSTTAVINPYISISNPVITVVNPITCTTLENIAVTVTTTGGVPPVYNYTINSIPAGFTQSNTTGIFNGLAVGDYMITVTNPVTNCSVQKIHYVFDPNTFDLNASAITDVTCFGASNGSVTLTFVDNQLNPTNDAGPFNYVITNTTTGISTPGSSPTAGPIVISGLNAGLYTVSATLVNTPNCTATTNFTINQPTTALTMTTSTTPITCNPGNDGSITAIATGGWSTVYDYQLLLGAATIYAYSPNNVFTGLAPGNYTVNVRDAKGCIVTANVLLSNPTPIAFTVTPNAPSVACQGDTTATLTVSYPTGGQGSNYSYTLVSSVPIPNTLSGPFAPIPAGGIVITGLGAGTYSVIVRDGLNCSTQSANIVINQPSQVLASLTMSTAPSCNQPTVLTLTGTGGTPPYTYDTSASGAFGSAQFNPSTTITISVNAGGTYHYYIKDANGCITPVSNDVVVVPPAPLVITNVAHTNILCGGDTSGTITAVAQGGLSNYVYSLYNVAIGGAPLAVSQPTPGYFTGLAGSVAGITYYVEVTSSGGCASTRVPVTITENAPLNATATPQSATCSGATDGLIHLTIAGGTGTIQYAISPNLDQFITITNPYAATGFDIVNLPAGTYTVVVQDQNGCYIAFNNINVTEPTPVGFNVTSVVDEQCAEDNLGSFTISAINGGTAPYKVTYVVTYPDNTTGGPGIPGAIQLANGITSYQFVNLNGGAYTAIVIDANGCMSDRDFIIDGGDSYTPELVVTYPCINNQPAVQIEVLNTSNTPSNSFGAGYSFTLDGFAPQTSPIFTSATYPTLLTPGSHVVSVSSPAGCDKVATPNPIVVAPLNPLTLTLSQGGLNTILATATGGTGDYVDYTFNGVSNGSSNTYIYSQSGTYTVVVTDSSGCTATATKPFTFIPIFIPDVFTPNGDGHNDGWAPQNTSNYKNLVTIIYDRYGREVARLNEGSTWDGKYEGKELPSGDYWYVVRVDERNAEEFVGHFTLYR